MYLTKIDNNEQKILNQLYDKMVSYLILNEKYLPNESIIKYILNKGNSNRLELLKNTALSENNFNKIDLESLLEKKYIQKFDANLINLTIKGIWECEKDSKIDLDQLLELINTKTNFEIKMKNVSDKNKILYFTMITCRAFSEETCFNLEKGKNDEKIKEKILECMKECSDFLFDLKIIKKDSEDDLFKSKGNFHPLTLLLHGTSGERPKETGLIYKAKNNKYFLDVSVHEKIDIKKLKKMFDIIIDKKLDSLEKEKINNFCNEMAQKYDPYIYEEGNIFNGLEFNKIIIDTLNSI